MKPVVKLEMAQMVRKVLDEAKIKKIYNRRLAGQRQCSGQTAYFNSQGLKKMEVSPGWSERSG